MENLAEIIRDFKRENINEHSTLTVVARRRQILHSAITALNKGYFDWHKRPQIEFVGEMADDYSGPTREFFRFVLHFLYIIILLYVCFFFLFFLVNLVISNF